MTTKDVIHQFAKDNAVIRDWLNKLPGNYYNSAYACYYDFMEDLLFWEMPPIKNFNESQKAEAYKLMAGNTAEVISTWSEVKDE